MTRVESDIIYSNKKVDELEERIKEHKESEQKVKEFADKSAKLGMTEELMNDFRMFLIGRVRPMLARFTSDLVSKMTNGRYHRVEIDEDYELSMFDRGIPYPLSRFSGGERAVVNLALRLALSQMIAVQTGTEGLGFIVLDEVFGSADSERRATIMETLNGLKNVYSQIICITHIDGVVDMIPNTVKIEIDGSVSKVVK
jgi:exonuclease SbcC